MRAQSIRFLSTILLATALAATPVFAQPADADSRDAEADSADEGADSGGDDAQPAGGEGAATDIEVLRREYLKLRDELFRSRARAAAVAGALYSTKLSIGLIYTSGRFQAVNRVTIRLDGANVYDDTEGAIAKDKAPRFEGFVAPGRHVINIRIETVGKDDERFTTTTDNTFTIQAPPGKDVTISATAKDSGDIAYAWQKKERGSYGLALDVKIDTTARKVDKKTAKGASANGTRTAQK